MISVIVPIYNVEVQLDRCIESIVSQSYYDLEIILVDDGSTDNCPAICDMWAEKDNRIKVIHKENGGVSSARNIGIELANGEYISFIDSDDVIMKNYYSILLSSIEDCDIAYCKYKHFYDNVEFDNITDFTCEYLSRDEAFKKGVYGNPEICFFVCNKLIKTELVNKIKFDEKKKNGEDSLFAFELVKMANKLCFVPLDIYGYYQRQDSASHDVDLQGYLNVLEVLIKIDEFYQKNFDKKTKSNSREALVINVLGLYNKNIKRKYSKEEAKPFFDVLKNNKKTIILTDKLNIKEKTYSILHIFKLV